MSLSKDNYCKLVVRMLALDSVIKFDYKSSKVKYSLFFFFLPKKQLTKLKKS